MLKTLQHFATAFSSSADPDRGRSGAAPPLCGETIELLEPRVLFSAVTVSTVADLVNAVNFGAVGDTVTVAPGTYELTAALEPKDGMTVRGSGQGLTVLTNATSWDPGTSLLPEEGAIFSQIDQSAYLFNLGNGADNVTIADMTITGRELHGAVFGFDSDGLTLHDLHLEEFAWSGVRTFVTDDLTIRDNTFVNAGREYAGTTGGAVYTSFVSNSSFYNNHIYKTDTWGSNFFGFKGRGADNLRIHHNQVDVSFSVEFPFENDQFVEIDHNVLAGTISIPRFEGGPVPAGGYTFHVHHNWLRDSFALEFARNGVEVNNNYFTFSAERDGGNLVTDFDSRPVPGPALFHNNQILNPGRGLFDAAGAYSDFSFYNNHVIGNTTVTPRIEGLFGFGPGSDFGTIEVRDNIIDLAGNDRPLMKNSAGYSAVIENNTLTGVSDTNLYANPDTGATRGLLSPLSFTAGVNNAFVIDGWHIERADGGRLPYYGIPTSVIGADVTRIEAEDYDNGGQGVAYSDSHPSNVGGAYRGDAVDIQATSDAGGGYNVGWIDTGEWLEYTVEVARTGVYDLDLRVASGASGGALRILLDGVDATGTVTIPGTGGWQQWQTVSVPSVSLTEGQHVVRIAVDAGGFNLNWAEFEPVQTPFGGVPVAVSGTIPTRIEAENYDQGGAGVAYRDFDTGNNGSLHRADDVDIETTFDTGGGFNLAWTNSGEWLEYTINVTTAGQYDLGARVASAVGGAALSIYLNGDPLSGPISVGNTGGWQSWITQAVPGGVTLDVGEHVLRVYFETGDINLNWIELNRVAPPPSLLVQAESYDTQSGTSLTGGGAVVGSINHGDYTAYNQVDFGSGFNNVTFRWSSATAGGSVELRLGSSAGTLVDTIALGNTGGWTSFVEQTFAINTISGVQDLYLVFSGPNALFDVDWFQFT